MTSVNLRSPELFRPSDKQPSEPDVALPDSFKTNFATEVSPLSLAAPNVLRQFSEFPNDRLEQELSTTISVNLQPPEISRPSDQQPSNPDVVLPDSWQTNFATKVSALSLSCTEVERSSMALSHDRLEQELITTTSVNLQPPEFSRPSHQQPSEPDVAMPNSWGTTLATEFSELPPPCPNFKGQSSEQPHDRLEQEELITTPSVDPQLPEFYRPSDQHPSEPFVALPEPFETTFATEVSALPLPPSDVRRQFSELPNDRLEQELITLTLVNPRPGEFSRFSTVSEVSELQPPCPDDVRQSLELPHDRLEQELIRTTSVNLRPTEFPRPSDQQTSEPYVAMPNSWGTTLATEVSELPPPTPDVKKQTSELPHDGLVKELVTTTSVKPLPLQYYRISEQQPSEPDVALSDSFETNLATEVSTLSLPSPDVERQNLELLQDRVENELITPTPVNPQPPEVSCPSDQQTSEPDVAMPNFWGTTLATEVSELPPPCPNFEVQSLKLPLDRLEQEELITTPSVNPHFPEFYRPSDQHPSEPVLALPEPFGTTFATEVSALSLPPSDVKMQTSELHHDRLETELITLTSVTQPPGEFSRFPAVSEISAIQPPCSDAERQTLELPYDGLVKELVTTTSLKPRPLEFYRPSEQQPSEPDVALSDSFKTNLATEVSLVSLPSPDVERRTLELLHDRVENELITPTSVNPQLSEFSCPSAQQTSKPDVVQPDSWKVNFATEVLTLLPTSTDIERLTLQLLHDRQELLTMTSVNLRSPEFFRPSDKQPSEPDVALPDSFKTNFATEVSALSPAAPNALRQFSELPYYRLEQELSTTTLVNPRPGEFSGFSAVSEVSALQPPCPDAERQTLELPYDRLKQELITLTTVTQRPPEFSRPSDQQPSVQDVALSDSWQTNYATEVSALLPPSQDVERQSLGLFHDRLEQELVTTTSWELRHPEFSCPSHQHLSEPDVALPDSWKTNHAMEVLGLSLPATEDQRQTPELFYDRPRPVCLPLLVEHASPPAFSDVPADAFRVHVGGVPFEANPVALLNKERCQEDVKTDEINSPGAHSLNRECVEMMGFARMPHPIACPVGTIRVKPFSGILASAASSATPSVTATASEPCVPPAIVPDFSASVSAPSATASASDTPLPLLADYVVPSETASPTTLHRLAAYVVILGNKYLTAFDLCSIVELRDFAAQHRSWFCAQFRRLLSARTTDQALTELCAAVNALTSTRLGGSFSLNFTLATCQLAGHDEDAQQMVKACCEVLNPGDVEPWTWQDDSPEPQRNQQCPQRPAMDSRPNDTQQKSARAAMLRQRAADLVSASRQHAVSRGRQEVQHNVRQSHSGHEALPRAVERSPYSAQQPALYRQRQAHCVNGQTVKQLSDNVELAPYNAQQPALYVQQQPTFYNSVQPQPTFYTSMQQPVSYVQSTTLYAVPHHMCIPPSSWNYVQPPMNIVLQTHYGVQPSAAQQPPNCCTFNNVQQPQYGQRVSFDAQWPFAAGQQMPATSAITQDFPSNGQYENEM